MKKVLVTGASGFLGGWVVESFFHSRIPVVAGIRRWSNAVRLARRPIEIVPCDVLSPSQLRSAMDGCEAVVHCAVGDDNVTITGTRNVLAAAEEAGLRRVVHISSVAVYGRAAGVVDETCQRSAAGNAYAQRKIDAELACDDFRSRGVPVVVLRPSIIYGPFSYTWTVSFANRIASGRWGTFGRAGEGKCNLVYVTDVVQAIYQSLHCEQAAGNTFNINGGEIVSWNDYFVRFNSALDRPPLAELNARSLAVKSQCLAPVRWAGRLALSRFRDTLMTLNSKSVWAARSMRVTESSLRLTPTLDQLRLYGQDVEYAIDRAGQQLGYLPQIGVTQGVRWGVDWARQQGLLASCGKSESA